MSAFKLPDGRLYVPTRADDAGVVGDGMSILSPDDPEYARWQDYFQRTGTQPQPWQGELPEEKKS